MFQPLQMGAPVGNKPPATRTLCPQEDPGVKQEYAMLFHTGQGDRRHTQLQHGSAWDSSFILKKLQGNCSKGQL